MKKNLIVGIGAVVTALTGTLVTATLVNKEKGNGLKVLSGAVATMAAILAAGCGVAMITEEEEDNYDTYHVEFDDEDDNDNNNYNDNDNNNYNDNDNNDDDNNNDNNDNNDDNNDENNENNDDENENLE